MALRRGRSDGDCRVLAEVLDDLSLAIFIVTADMAVVEANGAARNLAVEGQPVRVVSGALWIGENGRRAEIARAVAEAGANPSPAGSWTYVASLGRESRPSLHVYVRGIVAGRIGVYVVDPVQPSLPDGDLLQKMYRFSPAETRVVVELLQGHSVESAADVLSLSVHTVRAHLKNLFAKTGVRRQGELLHLIATSHGCLRGVRRNHSLWGCADAGKRLDSDRSSDSPGTS